MAELVEALVLTKTLGRNTSALCSDHGTYVGYQFCTNDRDLLNHQECSSMHSLSRDGRSKAV